MLLLLQQFKLLLENSHVKPPLKICFTVLVFTLLRPSFGMNATLDFDVTSEQESKATYTAFTIVPKMMFGALKWTFSSTDLYMALCNAEEDCDAGFRMICNNGRCVCKAGDLFFEWPKYGCFSKVHMFGQCEVSGQCAAMNPNTYCNPDNGRCTCSPNYFFNGRECSIRYDGSNLKAQEVYKAAVVAAACFIVAIVGIFVACIVRRSFCRRDQHLQQSESNRGSDIFSVSDEIAALRAVDKPPSYEEVLQIERTFYGIPPPEYSGPRTVSALEPFSLSYASSIPMDNPPSFQPTSQPHNSSFPFPTNMEYLKDSNTESAIPPHIVLSADANFLASVEVLPPPLETTVPCQVPVEPSHSVSHYISSTPPPPRLHRTCPKSTSLSSSLPGSPNLSSFSSTLRVLNLPNPLRNDLLKKNSTNPDSAACVPDNSEKSEISASVNESAVDVDDPSKNDQSELAYDNLGFVSDLQE